MLTIINPSRKNVHNFQFCKLLEQSNQKCPKYLSLSVVPRHFQRLQSVETLQQYGSCVLFPEHLTKFHLTPRRFLSKHVQRELPHLCTPGQYFHQMNKFDAGIVDGQFFQVGHGVEHIEDSLDRQPETSRHVQLADVIQVNLIR